jgi:hypothetical protein
MFHASEFESRVGECREAFSTRLPAIASRHSPLAVLVALTEHVGGALRLSMDSGSCTPAEAREVLERCESGAQPSGDPSSLRAR